MKKRMLFVIDSLDIAGAEKSLVTLLSLLDYSKFEVDLMLFGHGGDLEELVPKDVNILKPLVYTTFAKLRLEKALVYSVRTFDIKMLCSRIKYSYRIRKNKYRNSQRARIFWESASTVIESIEKEYDIAISYAQGIPTFFVAEKVKAKQKFAWVNASYSLDEREKQFQKKFYAHYKNIVTVSDSAKETFIETFPEFSQNIKVIYDINNYRFITQMADLGDSYKDKFEGIRILTIARFDSQKGYDIALGACRILKEKGINFRWYSLGKGPLKNDIEKGIKDLQLTEHFFLLGVNSNPYPFIKNADIYVQTSRFEGFGLAIAEARMLNIPVVTTRFDAVNNQMINGKNGLVVDMNDKAVSDAILNIIEDKVVRNDIIDFLKSEKKGNLEEIDKFYEMINEGA
jgi:glycosyltransferase involved in cell wall biosynthesis